MAFVNAHSLGTDVFQKLADDAAAYEYRFAGEFLPATKTSIRPTTPMEMSCFGVRYWGMEKIQRLSPF